ncbi:cysteine protease, putative [Entamoeba invadens IP1]|uniref:Cysteine protease, putative n=1 Tax=Entamoeba invadens IP1 TaxID=370355 RepID=A0A0A1UCF3_ENTIV|nr:cysteine protease, putative [Entamoeba invadens IP1]ELP92932.1 cysteine protease, putative [Entamoeba invadens IP1]|eukprot:XP_004259703.1 cysteine protease, putative [Entamoeba invadens IP1]
MNFMMIILWNAMAVMGATDELFEKFKVEMEHGKRWSVSEIVKRKAVFLANIAHINELNTKYGEHFGVNKYALMTTEEKRHLMGKKVPEEYKKSYKKANPPQFKKTSLPESLIFCGNYNVNNGKKYDYCASKTQNQGECGSCYAFGVAQLLETKYAMKTGRKEQISAQQILDCNTGSSERCCGGFPQDVLKHVKGYTTEKAYPYKDFYTSMDDCSRNKCEKKSSVLKVKSYKSFDNCYTEECVKSVLNNYGPFVTSMYASQDLQYYTHGVLDLDCGNPNIGTNHVVVVVGYGVEGGKAFLVIRNSWGDNWGENGYFRISWNDLCGIGGNDAGAMPTSVLVDITTEKLQSGVVPYFALLVLFALSVM